MWRVATKQEGRGGDDACGRDVLRDIMILPLKKDIVSYRIVSYRIVSYRIVSYRSVDTSRYQRACPVKVHDIVIPLSRFFTLLSRHFRHASAGACVLVSVATYVYCPALFTSGAHWRILEVALRTSDGLHQRIHLHVRPSILFTLALYIRFQQRLMLVSYPPLPSYSLPKSSPHVGRI